MNGASQEPQGPARNAGFGETLDNRAVAADEHRRLVPLRPHPARHLQHVDAGPPTESARVTT